MDYKEILNLKERIENGKQKLAELKGAKGNQLSNLKKEFNCSSVEDAVKLKKKYEKEIDELNEKIEVSVSELQDTYPDLFTEE